MDRISLRSRIDWRLLSFFSHRLENLFCKDRKSGSLKVVVGHVASDDFIVLSHPLDHKILN
jgi:hypothetical protein